MKLIFEQTKNRQQCGIEVIVNGLSLQCSFSSSTIVTIPVGLQFITVGGSDRMVDEIESWAPGLPVFGQLTPFPATPLYTRLEKAGRLHRPKHWLEFAPFVMAHNPLKMTIEEAKAETFNAWQRSYSPERNWEAIESIKDSPIEVRISHLVARLFFRGIYFPQMSKWAWIKLLWENRRTILSLTGEGLKSWRKSIRQRAGTSSVGISLSK